MYVIFSLYSMTKTNYVAKIPLTFELLKEKKKFTKLIAISLPLNSCMSFKCVYSC